MVKQMCPCSLDRYAGNAEINPQAIAEVPKPEQVDAWRRL